MTDLYDIVKSILRDYGIKIRDRIDVLEVLPYMEHRLSKQTIQGIKCVFQQHGPIRAADEFLDSVRMKPESFLTLLVVLQTQDTSLFEMLYRLVRYNPTLMELFNQEYSRQNSSIPAHENPSTNLPVDNRSGQYGALRTGNPSLPFSQTWPKSMGGNPVMTGGPPLLPSAQHVEYIYQREDPRQSQFYLPGQEQRPLPSYQSNQSPPPYQSMANPGELSDADTKIGDMDYYLWIEIIKGLEEIDADDTPNWKHLIYENKLKRISHTDVKTFSDSSKPAEMLLDRLDGYTLGELARMLHTASLTKLLDILLRTCNIQMNPGPMPKAVAGRPGSGELPYKREIEEDLLRTGTRLSQGTKQSGMPSQEGEEQADDSWGSGVQSQDSQGSGMQSFSSQGSGLQSVSSQGSGLQSVTSQGSGMLSVGNTSGEVQSQERQSHDLTPPGGQMNITGPSPADKLVNIQQCTNAGVPVNKPKLPDKVIDVGNHTSQQPSDDSVASAKNAEMEAEALVFDRVNQLSGEENAACHPSIHDVQSRQLQPGPSLQAERLGSIDDNTLVRGGSFPHPDLAANFSRLSLNNSQGSVTGELSSGVTAVERTSEFHNIGEYSKLNTSMEPPSQQTRPLNFNRRSQDTIQHEHPEDQEEHGYQVSDQP